MFCSHVSQTISLLGEKTFENDKIELEKLNDDASFFLQHIRTFDKTISKHDYDQIIDRTKRVSGLTYTGVIGLILKKTDSISEGDKLKPEFLLSLKKATEIVVTALSSNWKISQPISKLNDDTEVEIKNRVNPWLGLTQCVLRLMANNYQFKFEIYDYDGYDKNTIIKGKWKDLKEFTKILRKESWASKKPLSLVQIVCLHIFSNLETYKKMPEFEYLPQELVEKIQEEEKLCITLS